VSPGGSEGTKDDSAVSRADKPEPEADDLSEREGQVLRSIIREHVLTGEPIGSRTVSRGARLDLSPATIRSVMAALEERGLLTQPHTSAGRVPTTKAWRLYVDRMIHRPRMATLQAAEIERALRENRGEITDLLAEASRQLSRLSHHVGVVVGPEMERVRLEHFELVRLDPRRVVAIVIGRSGLVTNRIVEAEEPLEQLELDRIGRELTAEFRGRTLPEIRGVLRQRLCHERAAYDRLLARGLELGSRALAPAEGEAAAIFVEGTANLLDCPEFADPQRLRELVRTLDRRQTLIDLLGRVLDADGVQVVIGEESAAVALADCSLVASTYRVAGQPVGTVGIVGPTRMQYARAIALVDHLAHVLSQLFSGDDN
jgi:heat-inducible transcriptional repressor